MTYYGTASNKVELTETELKPMVIGFVIKTTVWLTPHKDATEFRWEEIEKLYKEEMESISGFYDDYIAEYPKYHLPVTIYFEYMEQYMELDWKEKTYIQEHFI